MPVCKADSIPDQWTALTRAYKTPWRSALQGTNMLSTSLRFYQVTNKPSYQQRVTRKILCSQETKWAFFFWAACWNSILLQLGKGMLHLFSASINAYCLPALWEDWIQDCRLCHWQGGSSVLWADTLWSQMAHLGQSQYLCDILCQGLLPEQLFWGNLFKRNNFIKFQKQSYSKNYLDWVIRENNC